MLGKILLSIDSRFEPQQVVHGYIPDWYNSHYALGVEADGAAHAFRPHKAMADAKRDMNLHSKGIKIVRFQNKLIQSDSRFVREKVQSIIDAIELERRPTAIYHATPKNHAISLTH